MQDAQYICRRKVCLADSGKHSDNLLLASEACATLLGIQGVFGAVPVSATSLELSYSIKYLSFDLIEALLRELGYYLDESVMARLRRNIYQYLEDNLREKLRVDENNRRLACDTESLHETLEPEKYWSDYR